MNDREQIERDDRKDGQEAPALRLTRLLCKRTGEQIEPGEHERCPYCFGKLADIESGRHEAFCDYRPGTDPVHFGFPVDDTHFEQG